MRLVIITLLVFSFAASVSAQEMPTYTCPDGSSVTPNVTLGLPAQPPASRDDLPEPYFVSVISTLNRPLLAGSDETLSLTCAAQDTLSETVSVSYQSSLTGDSTVYGFSPYSTWISADTSLSHMLALGDIRGTTVIVIEGGRMTANDETGDTYTLTLDTALIDAGMTLQASLLSVDSTYVPSLSVVDEVGEVVQDTSGPLTCDAQTCFNREESEVSYTGLRVPSYTSTPQDLTVTVPLTQPQVNLRVDRTDADGSYALILALIVPPVAPPRIKALAIDNGNGSWTVRCNSHIAFESGTKLTLLNDTITTETPLTLTALSSSSSVTIVVMTSPTEGYCVQPTLAAAFYAATLPDLDVPSSGNSTQVVLTETPTFILIGSEQVGPLTLLVEGWQTPRRETLAAEDTPPLATLLQPVIALDVTESMAGLGADVRVYGIAADNVTDPAVGFVADDGTLLTDTSGQILACNDAGVPDQCPPDSVSLTGYSVTLSDGTMLPGASLDAMTRLNLADYMFQIESGLPTLHIAAADRTGGGGPLVLVVAFVLGE